MVIKCPSLCREKFFVLVLLFSDNVYSYSAFLVVIFIFESKVYLLKYIVG